MPDVAEPVIDVTDQIERCLKAEQKGVNVLILRRLQNSIRRSDGRMARYELEYRWLSDPRYVVCVRGNEFSYWQAREIEGWQDNSLFDLFRLVP